MQALSEAYHALLKAIPSTNSVPQDGPASQQSSNIAPLNHEDYPNIKFWFKRNWTESSGDQLTNISLGTQGRGRAHAVQGINVSMRNVETEDSRTIGGDRATEIQKFARAVWVS